MKVAVNLLWLVPGVVGGSETAITSLLRQLAEDPPDDIELTLFALDEFGAVHRDLADAFPTRLVPLTGRLKPLRVVAENTWLARRLGEGFDLVHHMGGVVPLVGSVPSVVTVHDLQPYDMPENFSTAKRLYLQRTLPISVRRARVVIAPSEFVRRGVIERFGIAPERVRMVPWACEPASSEVSVAEVQARYRLPRRWFVYPAFTWWHKDHTVLLQAFAQIAAHEYDVVLVLTGGEGPAEAAVLDQITRLGLHDRVRRTGLIPRRDVLAIIRGAVAVTWPSRYEGFGLPALEAMQLGTPLLAVGGTGLAELIDGVGRLLPSGDAAAWGDAMAAMLGVDDDERAALAAAGRERAARYSLAATAAGTLAAYRQAVAETPPAETPPTEDTEAPARAEDTEAPAPTEEADKNDNGVAT